VISSGFSNPGPQESPFDGLRLTLARIGKYEVILELGPRSTQLEVRAMASTTGDLVKRLEALKTEVAAQYEVREIEYLVQ
jgi:hypothetical protein